MAGLDTRLWPLYFLGNLAWVNYAIMLGDGWLFMSAVVPSVQWLHFCLGSIHLMALEDGELLSLASILRTTASVGLEASARSQSLADMHKVTARFRQPQLRTTELSLSLVLTLILLVLFFSNSPRLVEGMPAWDDLMSPTVRVTPMRWLASGLSMICHLIPMRRLAIIVRLRDASSVFIPTTVGWLAVNITWGSYGFVTKDFGLIVPNLMGFCVYASQVVLKLAFRRKPALSIEGEMEMPCESVEAHVEALLKTKTDELRSSSHYEVYLSWQRSYQLWRKIKLCSKGAEASKASFDLSNELRMAESGACEEHLHTVSAKVSPRHTCSPRSKLSF